VNLNLYGYGVLALVCAGLYGWVTFERLRVEKAHAEISAAADREDHLKQQVKNAKTLNEMNVTELNAMKAEAFKWQKAAVAYETLAWQRRARINSILKEVHNAPASDDGPVAPVLERVLDSLRVDYASPDGADAVAGGEGNDPGVDAVLPDETGASAARTDAASGGALHP
jgi:hypothetical protein